MALNGISTATSSTSVATKIYRRELKLAEAAAKRASTSTYGYRVLNTITATHVAFVGTTTATIIGSASPTIGRPWSEALSVPPVVSTGLILHLDAGNSTSYAGTGTTWFDLSPSGYDATLVGPTFASNSFDFDGVNDYVDAGAITDIGSTSTEFSVELWFKPDATAIKSLIQNGSDYNTNTYYLWQQSATELVFEVWGGSGFDAVTFTDINDYVIGTWYHLVGVWKSGESLKLYKNADASANTPWSTGSIQNAVVNGNTNTIIGQRGSSFYYNGNMPIVRLYTKALTAIEVQQNFDAEKSRFGL